MGKIKLGLKRFRKLGMDTIWSTISTCVFESEGNRTVIGRYIDEEFIPFDEETHRLCIEYDLEYDKSLMCGLDDTIDSLQKQCLGSSSDNNTDSEDNISKEQENKEESEDDTKREPEEDTVGETEETKEESEDDTKRETKEDTVGETEEIKEETVGETKEETVGETKEETVGETKEETVGETKEETVGETKERHDTHQSGEEDSMEEGVKNIMFALKELNSEIKLLRQNLQESSDDNELLVKEKLCIIQERDEYSIKCKKLQAAIQAMI